MFLKKAILSLAAFTAIFAAVPVMAESCYINIKFESDEYNQITKGKDGFIFKRDYNEFCGKLKKANARLHFRSSIAVLDNRSIASVHINIVDNNLPIETGEFSGISTRLGHTSSMTEAYAIGWQSLNDAIDEIKIDEAIDSLNKARAKIRASISKSTNK